MPHGSSSGYFLIQGSIIFVSNETSSTYQDWCIDTSTRVELTFVKQTYQIALLSGMDLDVADVRRTNVTHLLNNFIPITVLNWLTFLIKISDVQVQCIQLLQPRDTCISSLQQFVQILTCVRAGSIEPVSKIYIEDVYIELFYICLIYITT